jgi:pimeloyl-ACP methyl ester carboxylesterase
VCGEGVPLVMIHGVIAEGMLYARTLRRLAGAGFKVIAVDSAGHGRTGGLGRRGWTWESYVDLHDQVLDHLGIERAVLVGHSMGGRLVVDLAARRPERAIAVMPINAAIGGLWDDLTGATRFVPFLWPLGVGLLLADTALSAVQGRKQMGALARLAAPSLAQRLRELPSMPAALWATTRAKGSIDTLRHLGDDGVPVFVLHGDRDFAIWFANARQAATAAGGTLVRIEGGLHSWLLEDADSLPSVIGGLLEGGLGTAIDERTESVDACYGPEALALTIDRPRSKPYQLEPSHRWRIEPTP